MGKYAVLLDGGFVSRKLGTAQSPMTIETVANFIERLSSHEALRPHHIHRAYYYDAAPLDGEQTKPLSREKIDFGKQPIAGRMRQLHSGLMRLPFFAVRMGELPFMVRGYRIAH